MLPHQANTRIIESAAKRLGLPLDRFFVNLERFGNTSSASIPIALCEAIGLGRVKAGDKVVLVGFGAGLTWAATALEWGIPVPLKRRRLDKQATSEFWFAFAPVRSFGLRVARRLYNLALGPEGGESWRGRIRERIDEWRRHLGDK